MLRISGFNEPFYLQWHITDHCNLSCSHCYRAEDKGTLERNELFSVLDKFGDFLKNKALKGRIQFCGGEPFLSTHLFDLIAGSSQKGLPTRVLSNGTLINSGTGSRLKVSGCEIVQISIDGNRDTHNLIRGDCNFEKAVAGAELLNEANIDVTVMMTVSKKNYRDLDAVYDISKGFAKRFAFSRLVTAGQAAPLHNETLSEKETHRFFRQCHNMMKKGVLAMPMRDPLWHAFLGKCNPHLISGCSIGYNGICVDSDGSVYPCRRLPVVIGNILTQDFDEIWASEVLERLRDRDALKGRCAKCRLRWQCGGCRAIAYALSGDYMSEDPQCFGTGRLRLRP